MAVAFVQTLLSAASTTGGGPGGQTVLSGSKTVTLGNRIYLLCATQVATPAWTPSSVTDNLGNVYSEDVLTVAFLPCNNGNSSISLWSAPVTVGGTLTTQTVNRAASFFGTYAIETVEFSGVGNLTGFDKACVSSDTSIGIPLTGTVTGLLLSCYSIAGGVTAFTPPAGWTLTFHLASGPANFDQGAAMCHKIGSESGTITASWTTAREASAIGPVYLDPGAFVPRIYRRR